MFKVILKTLKAIVKPLLLSTSLFIIHNTFPLVAKAVFIPPVFTGDLNI